MTGCTYRSKLSLDLFNALYRVDLLERFSHGFHSSTKGREIAPMLTSFKPSLYELVLVKLWNKERHGGTHTKSDENYIEVYVRPLWNSERCIVLYAF